MIRTLTLIAALGLAACNMQSPQPVLSAQDAEAKAACDGYVFSDMRYGGAGSDPLASCMQAYRYGWRPPK